MLLLEQWLRGGESGGEDPQRCIDEPLRASIVGEQLELTAGGGVWKALAADGERRDFGKLAASSPRSSEARRALDEADSEELDHGLIKK